jgi:putative hydrolase of the HAD superfamily
MPVRALMVDVDGVVVNPGFPKRRWDADLEADLGVSREGLQAAFFKPHFQEISLGRKPIEPHLAEVLSRIAPHVTAEQLMAYWFDKDSALDGVLLDDLAQWRAKGVELHLCTVQEHRRADYLWTTLGLKARFDGLHHSAALGLAKPDPAYFREVEARTGFSAADIAFIDDSPANVAAAAALGWTARLWTGEQRLADVLSA